MEYLPGLPPLSDVIGKIERFIKSDPKQRYGNWNDIDIIDPKLGLATQRVWEKYISFIEAGHRSNLLPCKYCTGVKQEDADALKQVDSPFSSLATKAAMHICGYNIDTGTPEEFRLFAQAMVDSAKAELDGFFDNPDNLLVDIRDHVFEDSSKNLLSAGEAAAEAVKRNLENRILTVGMWSDVIDQLDRVNWDDLPLLHRLARHSPCSHSDADRGTPLSAILLRMEDHEMQSMGTLEVLFQQWWKKNHQYSSLPPSPLHLKLQAEFPNLPEREVQAMSLDRTTKFERAIVRVCRPRLHPVVPFHVSYMEQLLLQKPTRAHKLSESLIKAIGYHSMVVEAHYMLRQYIHFISRKMSSSPTSVEHRCECGPDEGDGEDDDGPGVAANAMVAQLIRQFTRPHHTFRDELLFWTMTQFAPINWAHFLTVESTTAVPMLAGRELRKYLDGLVHRDFGCDLIDLMSGNNTTKWSWLCGQEGCNDIATCPAMLMVTQMFVIHHKRPAFRPEHQPSLAMLPPVRESSADHLTSLPIAQSGHAYLRDNPANSKVIRSPSPASSSSSSLAAVADYPAPKEISVNSKQMKVLQRLFGTQEGNVGWASLVMLFKRLKLRGKSMGGSAFHFRPIASGDTRKSIILYRPHPDPVFTGQQATAIGSQLGAIFGWSIDSFARQPEGLGVGGTVAP